MEAKGFGSPLFFVCAKKCAQIENPALKKPVSLKTGFLRELAKSSFQKKKVVLHSKTQFVNNQESGFIESEWLSRRRT